MSGKPRILIIENSIDVTGALKSIFAMATDLSDRYEFMFLLPKGSRAVAWINARSTFETLELPMIEIGKNLKALLYAPALCINVLRLIRIVRKYQIKIVHTNDLYNLLGPTARILARYKHVCHIRFLPDKFHPAIYGGWVDAQSRNGKLIAVSHFLRNKFRNDREIMVIHDRILPTQNHENVVRRSSTILCLSNIIRGKGHEHAIEAFANICAHYPEWKLRFVGGTMGREKNELFKKQLIRRTEVLKIAERVEWKNFSDDVELEYKTADISINFSESESFSMTCLESLYYGCPVVATRSGGPAEIIDDGISGILVNRADINDMAASMKLLIDDPVLRTTMGAEGAKRVRDRFNATNTSELLHKVYSDILA